MSSAVWIKGQGSACVPWPAGRRRVHVVGGLGGDRKGKSPQNQSDERGGTHRKLLFAVWVCESRRMPPARAYVAKRLQSFTPRLFPWGRGLEGRAVLLRHVRQTGESVGQRDGLPVRQAAARAHGAACGERDRRVLRRLPRGRLERVLVRDLPGFGRGAARRGDGPGAALVPRPGLRGGYGRFQGSERLTTSNKNSDELIVRFVLYRQITWREGNRIHGHRHLVRGLRLHRFRTTVRDSGVRERARRYRLSGMASLAIAR